MSYGSPRNFFSLPSINQMRNTLNNLNYYKDADRTQLEQVIPNETVTPYAEDEQGSDPMLDRSRIKSEYTVTLGSNFQFYLLTTTKDDAAITTMSTPLMSPRVLPRTPTPSGPLTRRSATTASCSSRVSSTLRF